MRGWLRRNVQWMIVMLLVLAVWAQSYTGRLHVVEQERAGCERQQQSLFGQLEDWYAAYTRAADAATGTGEPITGVNNLAAASYLATVRSDMHRVDRAHSLVWPDPRVRPGPYSYPLGYGTFDCDTAYPDPSPFDFVPGKGSRLSPRDGTAKSPGT